MTTTSKGQTKVDVEETKHGHGGEGKKGTRTDDDDDGVATSFCQKYYGFPATCMVGGIMPRTRKRMLSDLKPRVEKVSNFATEYRPNCSLMRMLCNSYTQKCRFMGKEVREIS